MSIYKVTSDETPTWGRAISVVVRSVDVLEAIDTALTSYGTEDWTRANCRADLIPVDGEPIVVVEENMGS